jgi:hypothetical protein
MVERICIGRVKNPNLAPVERMNWDVIPIPGTKARLHPNLSHRAGVAHDAAFSRHHAPEV